MSGIRPRCVHRSRHRGRLRGALRHALRCAQTLRHRNHGPILPTRALGIPPSARLAHHVAVSTVPPFGARAPCCSHTAPQFAASTQVALLFLSKGPIQTEPIWTAFIASAAELELRKAVPPARPAQPELFPEVPRSQEEVDAKCWGHGGMAVPLVVPPRPQYAGMHPRALRSGAPPPFRRAGTTHCPGASSLALTSAPACRGAAAQDRKRDRLAPRQLRLAPQAA